VTEVSFADTRHPNLVQLGAAHPNPHLAATKPLNRTLASVARRMGYHTGMYNYVPGCEALRVQIARRALSSGCRFGPDDVVITTGCTESINLCLRAVCFPGDTVAIESPRGFDALLSLDVLGLQALEIPTHPRDGISLDALRFALDHHRVSACLLVSNYSNPLGSCIPDGNKRELVALLASHDIPLIENDIFGELHFQDRRPSVAKAHDDKGLVMLCSSFSKSLSPGYRVGWVVPGRFVTSIRWLKYTSSLASPTLAEYGIAEFLASGSYEPYIRRIRRIYERHVGALSQAVRRFSPPGVPPDPSRWRLSALGPTPRARRLPAPVPAGTQRGHRHHPWLSVLADEPVPQLRPAKRGHLVGRNRPGHPAAGRNDRHPVLTACSHPFAKRL